MKLLSFNKKFLPFILMLPLLISLQGCIYLVVGSVGAVGGYIISPDTVEGVTENDKLSVWDATTDVVSIMGVILESYEDEGLMMAKINGAKVTITIVPVTDSATRFTVKARKAFLPRISIAQSVYAKVMGQLEL